MRNKVKSVMKENAQFLAGALTAVVAFLIAKLGCMVLVCTSILSVYVAFRMIKSRKYSKKGKAVIILIATLIFTTVGVWHLNNFHNVVEDSADVQATVEITTDEEKTPEETVVEETEVEEDGFVRNYLNDETRKECIDIEVTKESSKDIETGKVVVEGDKVSTFNEETTDTEDDIIIEQAKEDDTKEVTELEDGITAITEKVTDEEESTDAQDEEVVEEPVKVEIPEEVEEITSEESKSEENTEITKENIETNSDVEEDESEDFADMSDEELEDLFFETTIETETVVDTVIEVEDVVVSEEVEIEVPEIEIDNVESEEIVIEDVVEIEDETATDVEIEDVEEVEDTVVEEVETVEAVTVTPVDSYTTTVGSQIQFQVTGDDVVIEGLDGIDYSLSNGILTIDAGSEATVISVCVSNSVSSVNFDITVNGIIG